MNKILVSLLLGVFSISANAMLIDRGGGFIYDDVLDITWTQNANINSSNTWDNQVVWATGLSIVDTRPGAGGVTYDDWRLPSMDVNGDDTIVNCASATEMVCRDNEYGYLLHQHGVTSATPGLFTNVQNAAYWSGTEFASIPSNAWVFEFSIGLQIFGIKSSSAFSWAVRAGDVAAVPVPAAVWLFGSGLLGLLGLRRVRR